MNIDGQLGGSLQGLHQVIGIVRSQQTCHILDADGIGAHVLDALRDIRPVLQGVGIAESVGKSDLCLRALLLACVHCGLQVAEIVQAVKDADDVNAVCDGLLDEVFHDIVGVVVVAEDVLTAEQHLELGILEALLQETKPLPRILVKETQAGIEGRAAPAFHGTVPDLVHLVDDRQHFVCRHSGRKQGLVRVTQHCLHDLDRFFLYFIHLEFSSYFTP